ncbi:methionine ABC transporter ATP-binding protein [Clostridium hydrogeniformans]|uniref:methionine ABC transporter ATP-binding protein n=1 Tax=Clostridium hydrogeniformans TaxID=349933 RepID=UPI0004852FD0|nr:ATP-binding cassette domain-containing protein [Clostridium hydrogeniformans]
MIEIKNIKKTYETPSGKVEALKETSLNINKGDIYGIIGYSGAGKSTLIRCINLLEIPDGGEVIIKDVKLTSLREKELRKSREKIGMIFQHFNLMKSRTVAENIAYPLKGKGLNKKDIDTRVEELLSLVDLKDKKNSYPSQLSGGQKQRVAIARALANNPEVLLCDEATSALDPKTTKSILGLLKKINKMLNLTIVLITHEMQVIKEICNRVAVMDNGYVVEKGEITNIFSNPKENITKDFIATVLNEEKEAEIAREEDFENVYKLSYVGGKTREAIISKVSRDFQVDISILYGNIEKIQDTILGNLLVKVEGESSNTLKALEFIRKEGIKVEVIKDDRYSKLYSA